MWFWCGVYKREREREEKEKEKEKGEEEEDEGSITQFRWVYIHTNGA